MQVAMKVKHMIDQVQNLKSNDYRKLCAKQNEN
jgi:hypothetical protein